jgi:glucose-6-phosphate isomerase
MTYQALSPGGKDAFFVSNVDPADLSNVLEKIDLDSTIFVVVSKTFTTQETMLNAQRVRELIVNKYGIDAIAKKFVAVSTNLELCKAFGISSDRIFGFWDWVGGRYSLSSAVGLSLAMCFGRETFTQLLAGMHDFDKHLQNASPDNNLAIWHAICNVYNINYLDFDALAVIAYSAKLKEFASYLQQLIMESNGKSVNLTNEKITYKTSPIILASLVQILNTHFFRRYTREQQIFL